MDRFPSSIPDNPFDSLSDGQSGFSLIDILEIFLIRQGRGSLEPPSLKWEKRDDEWVVSGTCIIEHKAYRNDEEY